MIHRRNNEINAKYIETDGNNIIYEYLGNNYDKKYKKIIDDNDINRLRISKRKFTNIKDKINLQNDKNRSLKKERNTLSTSSLKILDLKKNHTNQISGFELYYGPSNIINDKKSYNNINNYKYNNIYYSNINLYGTNNNNNYRIENNNEIIYKLNKYNNHTYNNRRNQSKAKQELTKKINKSVTKFRNYLRPSETKKIILIQSKYRANLSKKRLYQYKFLILLNKILLNKFWKNFKSKLVKVKYIKNNKIISRKKNLISTNKKIIMKTNEVNLLHKELGDSFNIINDELKIKLDDIIKENKELKNQIIDNNKSIEEKMKQLLDENKKNQNINEIIIKDNKILAKKLKNLQYNKNNQLVIQNQSPVDLTLIDDNKNIQSISKLKYIYLKCIFLKKIIKNKNVLRIFFNRYKNNIKKINNNNKIYLNNNKKINIQMAKNFNINLISQIDIYNKKNFLLYKLFLNKEKNISKIITKFFYKYYYNAINTKEENNEKNKKLLINIIKKKENKNEYILRNIIKEWKLRGVIFKMKGIAKEFKKRKKLKKKIRDKMAKETLNNLINKTSNFQSSHEFSYKIEKTERTEDNKEDIKEENILLDSDNSN